MKYNLNFIHKNCNEIYKQMLSQKNKNNNNILL